MTEYTTGQDVLVESEEIHEGEALIATVHEDTESSSESTLIVTRDAATDTLYHVHSDEVVTLTEVFDEIRA